MDYTNTSDYFWYILYYSGTGEMTEDDARDMQQKWLVTLNFEVIRKPYEGYDLKKKQKRCFR